MTKYLPSAGLDPAGLPSRFRLGNGVGRVQARLTYQQQIRLPKPQRCGERPTHLIAAIDSSGSVTGGNDPVGQRFLECQVAIERVASKCSCNQELVSVLHFDHPVQNDVLAANLRDKETIEAALKVPYDGGGCSLLGSSLRTAYSLATKYPDHRTVLIALTDFQLFDPPGVLDDFLTFPGEVHACVLGGGYVSFENTDTPTVITKIERGNTPGAVARAVFDALSAERGRR